MTGLAACNEELQAIAPTREQIETDSTSSVYTKKQYCNRSNRFKNLSCYKNYYGSDIGRKFIELNKKETNRVQQFLRKRGTDYSS